MGTDFHCNVRRDLDLIGLWYLSMTDGNRLPLQLPGNRAQRCFAALRMTGLDLAGGEELSSSFEPRLNDIIRLEAVLSSLSQLIQ